MLIVSVDPPNIRSRSLKFLHLERGGGWKIKARKKPVTPYPPPETPPNLPPSDIMEGGEGGNNCKMSDELSENSLQEICRYL